MEAICQLSGVVIRWFFLLFEKDLWFMRAARTTERHHLGRLIGQVMSMGGADSPVDVISAKRVRGDAGNKGRDL